MVHTEATKFRYALSKYPTILERNIHPQRLGYVLVVAKDRDRAEGDTRYLGGY